MIFLAIALTDFQFLQRLTPLFNAIGDGHSWIRPSRSYINHLFKNSKLLPLGVKIVDDRVFITKNFGNNKAVQKGMEVHAVNGMKTGAILQALRVYVTADGYNQTWKTDRLSNDFSYFLSHLFGSQDQFTLKTTLPDGTTEQTIQVGSLLEDDWIKNTLPPNRNNFRTSNWNYHQLNDSTGYLSLYTFARGQRFRSYLDEVFPKIDSSEIQHLIIDLRDNYGGSDPNGPYLFSYLAQTPFRYFNRYETRAGLSEEELNRIGCCISSEEVDFIKAVSTTDGNGQMLLTNFEQSGFQDPSTLISPKSNAFRGQLYLLVNGGSFSVTADFCSLVHDRKRGIVIGEESGGGYYGNTSGMNKLLLLPSSGLRANINFIKFVNHRSAALGTFGRGVLPDHTVKPSQQDIAEGNDPELAFALKLITHGQ